MPNVAETIVPLQTRIPIGPADVVSLEQRKLDALRTTILITGIVTGIATGVGVALRAGGGSDPGKNRRSRRRSFEFPYGGFGCRSDCVVIPSKARDLGSLRE
jgi:hypothetical protein